MELGKRTIQITSSPSESEIEQYWGDILKTEVCRNDSAFWLSVKLVGHLSQAIRSHCLKRIGNWKTPGSDQVYGYGSSALRVFMMT